jgi:tetratricopeptide (TPR) repeat protein
MGVEAQDAASRAAALQRQGHLDEAAAAYRQALALQPDSAEVACNLGVSLAGLKRWAEACDAYRLALRLRADFPEVACNLGNALKEMGQIAEAIAAYRQAMELRPDFAEAHFNLGNTYHDQGEHREAIEAFRQALAIRPRYAKAANNLGNVFKAMGQLDDARREYELALQIRPDYAAAQDNLAMLLHQQGRHVEALHTLQRRAANSSDAEVHQNMGVVLTELARYPEALAQFGRAIELAPDFAAAHTHRAIIHLLLGNLGRGFAEYEWRWKQKNNQPAQYRQPRWQGASLVGRTILLHAEQGSGDVMQFARYAALVKEYGGTTVLGCHPALARLLSTAPGIDRVVSIGEALPAFDVQVPVGSLPDVLGTTLPTIPSEVPYLFADPQLSGAWKREMALDGSFRVGIAWQGNPQNPRDHLRSMPLSALLPLGHVPGVRLYSLQHGFGSEQLAPLAGTAAIVDVGSRCTDYADTAAAMSNLDLVITVDSSLAHLAGALGLPTWVMISKVPDWRWMLDRADSPWYPTMRLFRQREAGDKEDVVQRVRLALIEIVALKSA